MSSKVPSFFMIVPSTPKNATGTLFSVILKLLFKSWRRCELLDCSNDTLRKFLHPEECSAACKERREVMKIVSRNTAPWHNCFFLPVEQSIINRMKKKEN